MPQTTVTNFFDTTPKTAHLFQMNANLFAENAVRSQNEQQLYIAWQQSEKEKQQMQITINSLHDQLRSIKLEIDKLKSNQIPIETFSQDESFEPNDTELADDTEWVRIQNSKKKRKRCENKSSTQSATNTNKTYKLISQTETKPKITCKPPPIMVTSLNNIEELTSHITEVIGDEDYQTILMNNNTLKVNVTSENAYRVVTKALKSKNVSWYSFENKQNRDIRVMIKNLHHTFQPINIIQSLKDQGFDVLNATPKLRWKTKEPLDMFLVLFHKDTDINKIYNLKTICKANVTVEPIKGNKLLPQCKICQSFGHTKNYCNKAPKCVKCAGAHLTSECRKPDTIQPKCCHCGKNHPANYRGCEVIKELQKLRDNQNKSKQLKTNSVIRTQTNINDNNINEPKKNR